MPLIGESFIYLNPLFAVLACKLVTCPCGKCRETIRAAETARELLWGDDSHVPLRQFQSITQTLVDLFSPFSPPSSAASSARSTLIDYEACLRSNFYTNASLNALPLPRILDPLHSAPPPERLRTLLALVKATLSSLVLLPFFLLPLLAHTPIYVIGKGTQLYLNTDEPEAYAQNKIVFSLLVLLLVIYPSIFFFTWALFLFTPLGLAVALCWTAAFSYYHTRLVDGNYAQWKRLVAAWRVLLGLWSPGRGEETRRMLKLRSEAAKGVADLLFSLEKEPFDAGGSSGSLRDKVDWFRSLGARIGKARGGLADESDQHGRLKQG